MIGRMSGQTVVVTGAGRGLGRAVAVGMAQAGAKLWICARTDSELAETANQIKGLRGEVEVRNLDLTQWEACEKFADEILDSSQVDVLVNNAAILQFKSLESISKDDWSQTLAVNLSAAFLMIQKFLPGMSEQGGSVINVSSRAGVLGFSNEAAYCTTKFGLEGLTQALAKEFEGKRISINTLTPGLRIKPTSMTEKEFENLPPVERKQWNDPKEIVPAFIFLACLRGEVGGLRFDAQKLSQVLAVEGFDLSPQRIKEIAE
jgi:NAD(P)-dependent dehydrogenase (short-subunit alcohol dehydrogenase family)